MSAFVPFVLLGWPQLPLAPEGGALCGLSWLPLCLHGNAHEIPLPE